MNSDFIPSVHIVDILNFYESTVISYPTSTHRLYLSIFNWFFIVKGLHNWGINCFFILFDIIDNLVVVI